MTYDLSNVKLYTARLPISPMDLEDLGYAGALDFLTRHRGCYEEHRKLVSREFRRTDRACDNEAEHDTFWHPSVFKSLPLAAHLEAELAKMEEP